MTEVRGRGRAALFILPSSKDYERDPVPLGRGRLMTEHHSNGINSSGLVRDAKPRGRGAFLKSLLAQNETDSSTVSDEKAFDTQITSSSSGIDTMTDTNISKLSGTRGRGVLFAKSQVSSSGIGSEVISNSDVIPHASGSSDFYLKPNPPVQKHGNTGQPLAARANYLRLELADDRKGIYEYEVIFDPILENSMMKGKLIHQHWLKVGGKVKIFDGGHRVWTPEPLLQEITTGEYSLYNGNKVQLKTKYKKVKPLKECDCILNIILKRIKSKLDFVQFGRKDYCPGQKCIIPQHKIEVWPGFVTAVEEFEGGIFINIDVSHRVLQSGTVLEKINECKGSKDFRKTVLNQLVGTSVMTSYNKRIYKIHDVDFVQKPTSTFNRKGEPISFVDYYKEQYGLKIKDLNQCLLVYKSNKKPLGKEEEDVLIRLIPELCHPTGLTEVQRSNFNLMKSVAQFTRVAPQERDAALQKFIQNIYTKPEARQILEEWGLRLLPHSIDLPSRLLQPERIYFGNNRTVSEPNADWSRAASNNEMLSANPFTQWAILCVSRDRRAANNFFETLKTVSRKIKLRIDEPELIVVEDDNAAYYCNHLKKLTKCIQIVVVIFPTQRDDRYASVKKLCNSDLGLPSQVINSKTLSGDKSRASVVTKIILQMTCKVGGSLWGVMMPYKEEGIMFCGIDVYHEASRMSQSVVALVCSLDKKTTRWTSGTALHNRGQEISDFCSKLFLECMQQWYSFNGSYPKRIVIFRDGVGDGQLSVTRDFEVPQFIRVIEKIDEARSYRPYFTYIIVQKRINTRYYVRGRNGDFENPPPGTVIDHTITRRNWFDYFLVSQNVRQGTVSPTHYVVVSDNSDMTVDTIQTITYKLTHLYYNWSGTVRVPAPCQYAHKLAYLVGQHTHRPAHECLKNTLYFL